MPCLCPSEIELELFLSYPDLRDSFLYPCETFSEVQNVQQLLHAHQTGGQRKEEADHHTQQHPGRSAMSSSFSSASTQHHSPSTPAKHVTFAPLTPPSSTTTSSLQDGKFDFDLDFYFTRPEVRDEVARQMMASAEFDQHEAHVHPQQQHQQHVSSSEHAVAHSAVAGLVTRSKL